MPYCDQCGAQNPDWARFCDQCGNPLTPVAAPATPQQTPPPQAGIDSGAGAAMNQCPQCASSVLPGEAFCDTCGAPLLSSSPATGSSQGSGGIPPQQHYPAPQPIGGGNMSPPPPAAAPVPPAPSVASHPLTSAQLVIPASNVTLPLPASDQLLIGRADAVSGVYPDIDLTSYGGVEKGVGRRHLHLLVRQGQVMVEDLDSTNGTFVNGQRLTPHTPQPINSGDEIRLGMLALQVQW